jgi:hypothetical protein
MLTATRREEGTTLLVAKTMPPREDARPLQIDKPSPVPSFRVAPALPYEIKIITGCISSLSLVSFIQLDYVGYMSYEFTPALTLRT